MGKADRISGVFWLCFSILMIIQSYRLGLGTINQPGPGFLFFWVNIVLGHHVPGCPLRGMGREEKGGAQPAIFAGQKMSKDHPRLLSLFIYVRPHGNRRVPSVTLLFFVFLLGIIEKKKWYFTVFMSRRRDGDFLSDF